MGYQKESEKKLLQPESGGKSNSTWGVRGTRERTEWGENGQKSTSGVPEERTRLRGSQGRAELEKTACRSRRFTVRGREDQSQRRRRAERARLPVTGKDRGEDEQRLRCPFFSMGVGKQSPRKGRWT